MKNSSTKPTDQDKKTPLPTTPAEPTSSSSESAEWDRLTTRAAQELNADPEEDEAQRSVLNYKSVEERWEDTRIMRILDEIYMMDPSVGSRRLPTVLERDHGIKANPSPCRAAA